MDELRKALKIAFASEYAFFIKAQNFHWNVEGMFFEQFHALFGGIYEEVYENIDPFAENIRKEMVFVLSEREGEHGLSDFLAGRQDAHRKHQWMLRATLK